MIKKALFVGHLGLGDHVILHGAVKHFANLYESVHVPVKDHNKSAVDFMCKKMSNVYTVGIQDENDLGELLSLYRNDDQLYLAGLDVIKSGYRDTDSWNVLTFENRYIFDQNFYTQLGLDFQLSFDWDVPDGENSQQIISMLDPECDFCFVHDDPSRGYNIKINTSLKMVKNSVRADTFFDYLGLIRKAKEIHCMDSSLALIIDRSDIPDLNPDSTQKLFLHRYLRASEAAATYQKNWTIIHKQI
tara:strand:+ start:643 stop:1377 length:735 start_codon:yes stop_codon:yes gene_type:complete